MNLKPVFLISLLSLLCFIGCGDTQQMQEMTANPSNTNEPNAMNGNSASENMMEQDTMMEDAPAKRMWCKALSSTSETQIGESTIISRMTAEWDGNTQYTTSSTTQNGVTTEYTSTSVYNEYGYILSTETIGPNYFYSISTTYDCSSEIWCKVLSTTGETRTGDQSIPLDVSYEWDGNTQRAIAPETQDEMTPESIHVNVYNDYGYALSTEISNESYSQSLRYTYDCSPRTWCKMLSMTGQTQSGDQVTPSDATYEWEGNTQTYRAPAMADGTSSEYSTTSTYNEYGQVLSTEIRNEGYIASTTTTYDCSQ